MLCNSLLEVAGNANQTFWLNGKRPKLPSKLKWSIRFWLKVWLLLGKVEMETRIFWHGTASFDRIRPPGQREPPVEVDHFHHRQSNELKTEWAACALTRKFPHGRKRSIYFSTEISKTFNKMERTLRVDQKKRGTGNSYHRRWILQLRLWEVPL